MSMRRSNNDSHLGLNSPQVGATCVAMMIGNGMAFMYLLLPRLCAVQCKCAGAQPQAA